MKRSTTYLAEYKHIGVLEIIVSGSSATVISILGVKCFNFMRHPVGRYGMLKVALRGYFSAFIENYRRSEAPIKVQGQGGFLNRLINFMTILALESPDPATGLKKKIAKDIKLFDWEDLSGFMEVESYENLIDVFHVPILVQFENFRSGIFSDETSLEVLEREVTALNIHHKPVGTSKKVFENFIKSEISFYRQLSQYDDKKFSEITDLYRIISSYLTTLDASDTTMDAESFLNDWSVSEETGVSFERTADGERPVISSTDIANVYLKNFDGFSCCFELLNEFQRISDEYDLKMKMTNILARVTSYAKAFGNLCEVDDTVESRIACLKFQKFNQVLDDHADRLHLGTQSHYKKLLEKNVIDSQDEILSVASCTYGEDNRQYVLVLYSEHIAVVEDGCRIKLLMRIENIDIILYNRYVYLIGEEMNSTLPVLCQIFNRYGILAFGSFDREATEGFCSKFYKTKYKCKMMENYFYTMDSTDTARMFRDVIVVSNYGGDEMLLCKISDRNTRAEGIEGFTHDELLERIQEEVNIKRNSTINTAKNLNIIKVVAGHSDAGRVKKMILEIYPEDEISFDKKVEILNWLCRKIFSLKDGKCQYTAEEMMEIVETRVIDRTTTAKYINEFNTTYYQLIIGQPEVVTEFYSTVEENVIMLCMILYRNLYDFFDPEDLEKTISTGKMGWCSSMNTWMEGHLEMLARVLNHLDAIGCRHYQEIILKVLHVI